MKVLIGTTNPSKAEYFAAMLEGFGVEFVTLRDLGIEDEPQETGRSFLDPAWEETPQLSWDRESRLRRFLIETLGLA